ncbi:MAG: sulfate ABC transporter permease subunit [Anaerolineales bacterium]|nr:sulfate ABC transporter permease subunit [Anaerolineales bacterium]
MTALGVAGAASAGRWRRWVMIGMVWAYAGLLVGAPVAALLAGALRDGLGALLAALSRPAVAAAFALTAQIAGLVVVVHGVFGTLVAWVLVRHRFTGRAWVNALIDLPFAVSAVVVGYMLLLIFGRTGLLGPMLAQWGLKVAFSTPGMVLATLFVTLPFMIRQLMPVMEAFGPEQGQAAATLGASEWQTFWWVTFPALRWGFVYGLGLTLARALGEFGAVLVIGGGIQGRTDTATIYIYHALEERQYVGAYGAALALGLVSLGLMTAIGYVRRRVK